MPRRKKSEKSAQEEPQEKVSGSPLLNGAEQNKVPPHLMEYAFTSALDDMRHVLVRNKAADRTPGQKSARQLLERSYKEFHLMFDKLRAEKEAEDRRARGEAEESAEEPIKDQGAARVGKLVDDLLANL